MFTNNTSLVVGGGEGILNAKQDCEENRIYLFITLIQYYSYIYCKI